MNTWKKASLAALMSGAALMITGCDEGQSSASSEPKPFAPHTVLDNSDFENKYDIRVSESISADRPGQNVIVFHSGDDFQVFALPVDGGAVMAPAEPVKLGESAILENGGEKSRRTRIFEVRLSNAPDYAAIIVQGYSRFHVELVKVTAQSPENSGIVTLNPLAKSDQGRTYNDVSVYEYRSRFAPDRNIIVACSRSDVQLVNLPFQKWGEGAADNSVTASLPVSADVEDISASYPIKIFQYSARNSAMQTITIAQSYAEKLRVYVRAEPNSTVTASPSGTSSRKYNTAPVQENPGSVLIMTRPIPLSPLPPRPR